MNPIPHWRRVLALPPVVPATPRKVARPVKRPAAPAKPVAAELARDGNTRLMS